MRKLALALAFLALPTLAAAQQADVQEDFSAPKVELQQTTPAPQVNAEKPGADQADAQVVDVETRSQTMADDAAAMQDPTQPRWWWLVGAIVVAGIILAVIL